MFELPSLLYPYDALEPHIDAETMEIHHSRHHATYVQNLNAALEGTKWAKRPLAQILDNLDSLPQDMRMPVRNNGGGHANHSLFWTIMAPEAGGEPAGDIGRAISDSFDSFARFKEQFTGAATGRFGSGWAWLIHDGTGLAVVSTPNQDSPLMQGDVPLLGLDVWEHSYYLRYQNRRIDYIEAWWNLVDWSQVEANLQQATARPASLTV